MTSYELNDGSAVFHSLERGVGLNDTLYQLGK
jgi:hypothetical protein